LKYFQNKMYLSGDHHTDACPATTTPPHHNTVRLMPITMKGLFLKYFQNKMYLSGDHHTDACPATTTPPHHTKRLPSLSSFGVLMYFLVGRGTIKCEAKRYHLTTTQKA
jgi:hypothetical protein